MKRKIPHIVPPASLYISTLVCMTVETALKTAWAWE